jgi:hypothetical protein
MTDDCVHLLYISSWKFHQLADGHAAPLGANELEGRLVQHGGPPGWLEESDTAGVM